jgi:hypothetical protein
MLAFIRWIFRFLRKEEMIFEQYSSEHPHFKWYLGMDAIITSVVVFFATAFVLHALPSQRVDADAFKHNGVMKMSASGLINHAKKGRAVVYWVGKRDGESYTHNDFDSKKVIITYMTNGKSPIRGDMPAMAVTTYQDLATYKASLHPISSGHLICKKIRHSIVKFEPLEPTSETITFTDRPQVIVIDYTEPQDPQVLLKNAKSLSRIA